MRGVYSKDGAIIEFTSISYTDTFILKQFPRSARGDVLFVVVQD